MINFLKYDKIEIMDLVAEVLGENADGIYVYKYVTTKDLDTCEGEIYSSLENGGSSIGDCRKYSISCGMTKMVIIPNYKTDWVIKIPYTHIYEYESDRLSEIEKENDEDDMDSMYKTTGYSYNGEIGSGSPVFAGTVEYDYCDMEVAAYENAEASIKDYLAETIFVGYYNNIPIYIQKRAYGPFSVCGDDFCKHIVEHAQDLIHYTFNYEFVQNLIFKIGFKMAQKILNELADIDDIHEDNYGFAEDGTPLIIDYSGYEGPCSFSYSDTKEVA